MPPHTKQHCHLTIYNHGLWKYYVLDMISDMILLLYKVGKQVLVYSSIVQNPYGIRLLTHCKNSFLNCFLSAPCPGGYILKTFVFIVWYLTGEMKWIHQSHLSKNSS